ncbi:MAG: ABC transporter substrate-binding protein [Deltaproteobacteria bacterium]|jgi:peptide/nickel transport system substrate-binding protein|nr:ABC transporter substrate-binding protein [Deltaproteobacteria bacterium]
MRGKSIFKLVVLGSALLMVLGVNLTSAAAEKVLYVSGDPNELGVTTFNPIKVELSHDAMWLIYDRFIERDSINKYYPGLAESWEISEDGLVWKLKLKKGVKFHDGSPFNAEVAKWFFKEMGTGPSAYMVAGIDRIEINDPHAITIYFKNPEPNMLFNLSTSFMCVPSMAAYKKYGEDYGIKYVVGSGPFKYESWKPGDSLTVVKNPEYTWGPAIAKNKGPALIDKVVYREIKDESTRFLELKTGKLDVLFSVPTMFLEKVEQDPKVKVVRLPGVVLFHMVMNTQSEPLNDLMVRKGIALAIDQDSITKNVFAGAGQPAHNYLISSLPSSNVPKEFQIYHNLEAANAALDKAGWKTGTDGIRVNKDGQRLELKMWAKNESTYRRVAEVIQAQLAQVGVDAKITLLDPSTIRTQLRKGEHQLAVRSYNWENADILEWFLNSKRMGYPNAAMWHDNESDYLMQKAMTRSRSMEERIDNFKDYHRYVLSQFVWAPIYLPDQIFAVNERVVLPQPLMENRLVGATILDYDLK